jgi:hypothetical protein
MKIIITTILAIAIATPAVAQTNTWGLPTLGKSHQIAPNTHMDGTGRLFNFGSAQRPSNPFTQLNPMGKMRSLGGNNYMDGTGRMFQLQQQGRRCTPNYATGGCL